MQVTLRHSVKVNKPVDNDVSDRRAAHRAQTTEGITDVGVDILGVSHIGSVIHVIHCHFYLTTFVLRLHANTENNKKNVSHYQ